MFTSTWNAAVRIVLVLLKIALVELLIPLTQMGNDRRKRRTDEVQPHSKKKRAGGGPASKENTKHIVGSLQNAT